LRQLQKSLGRLVGSSSGYIESLPKPVQRRIEYVRGIEEERGELEEQYLAERRVLEQKYAKLYGEPGPPPEFCRMCVQVFFHWS
jgi:nucleosome assembly protein 1-like 1